VTCGAYVAGVTDRYGRDVLARVEPARVRTQVPAETGLVVECAQTGWCGAITNLSKGSTGWAITLEDRHGRRRMFNLSDPFLIDGELVTLTRPLTLAPSPALRTASGSVAVVGQRARVARACRIWVEGSQDAQLVEKIWGDDLRVEGVVVEHLSGADHLSTRLHDFGPSFERRVGVLLDHMVDGSKETKIAQNVSQQYPEDVLVIGHPYVDIWQAIRPQVLGLSAWPVVPRGIDWKTGVCEQLGWISDTGAAWRAIIAKVHTYADLEPSFLGRVEQLIDFVTT
jgi:Protein of unknown function (DUF3097)